MEIFKIGDVVTLKSGGPLMTVSTVMDLDDREVLAGHTIRCTWFDGKKESFGVFHPGTLKKNDDGLSLAAG